MGGTPQRMENFAHFLMDEIGYKLPTGLHLNDISKLSCRYAMYKVGPVLSISHGMGVPSIGILLHEMIKLCHHAKCKDPIFIRIGTCGGIGVQGGTVVVSNDAVDGLMRSSYEMVNSYTLTSQIPLFIILPLPLQTILGKTVLRPAKLDQQLVKELKSLTSPEDPFKTVEGKTMCANDFYEGQGRLDGAFCEYGEEEKLEFLRKLANFGVVNIEMECTVFGAMTYMAGIRGAIVCVALLDRLHGDQVETPKATLTEWQNRPKILVSRLIKKHLAEHGAVKMLEQIPVGLRCPEHVVLQEFN